LIPGSASIIAVARLAGLLSIATTCRRDSDAALFSPPWIGKTETGTGAQNMVAVIASRQLLLDNGKMRAILISRN
jgi:hypothetical protein